MGLFLAAAAPDWWAADSRSRPLSFVIFYYVPANGTWRPNAFHFGHVGSALGRSGSALGRSGSALGRSGSALGGSMRLTWRVGGLRQGLSRSD